MLSIVSIVSIRMHLMTVATKSTKLLYFEVEQAFWTADINEECQEFLGVVRHAGVGGGVAVRVPQ